MPVIITPEDSLVVSERQRNGALMSDTISEVIFFVGKIWEIRFRYFVVFLSLFLVLDTNSRCRRDEG